MTIISCIVVKAWRRISSTSSTAKAQDSWPHYFLQPHGEKGYFHFGYRLRPQNVMEYGHVDYTLRVLRSLAISTAI